MTTAETIGANIERIRKAQGFGRHAFAERAGISADTLRALERGKKDVRLSTLQKVADALGVEVRGFFR